MRPDIIRDLAMVHHPNWWPIDGVLPLTHVSEMEPEPNPLQIPKLGFILEEDAYRTPIKVKVGCVHLTALGIQKLEELAEKTYADAKEMLQDWRVD